MLPKLERGDAGNGRDLVGNASMTTIRRWLGHHEAIWLACLIWTFYVLGEISIALGSVRIAVIWAAHGLALMLIMKAFLDRARFLSDPSLRIGAIVLLPVTFAFMQTALDLAVTLHLGDAVLGDISAPPGMEFNANNLSFQTAFKLTFRGYIWLFGFYAIAISLLRAVRDGYEARLEAQDARLEALRLQVAPHFLFNALNSLSALVASGRRDDAEAMIGRLSDFYRSSLLASDGDLGPLEQEIDAVSDYLEIEHVRFGDRLRTRFAIAEGVAGARIPRMILQPLVENAVKHAVVQTSATIELRVSAHAGDGRLVLAVANDRASAAGVGPIPGTGTGLVNIRRRLAALYGRAAALSTSYSDTEWRAEITIPLPSPAEEITQG